MLYYSDIYKTFTQSLKEVRLSRTWYMISVKNEHPSSRWYPEKWWWCRYIPGYTKFQEALCHIHQVSLKIDFWDDSDKK